MRNSKEMHETIKHEIHGATCGSTHQNFLKDIRKRQRMHQHLADTSLLFVLAIASVISASIGKLLTSSALDTQRRGRSGTLLLWVFCILFGGNIIRHLKVLNYPFIISKEL